MSTVPATTSIRYAVGRPRVGWELPEETMPESVLHDEIVAFLIQKWDRERDYRLIKEIWGFGENRIAVRFASESMGTDGLWYRSSGNENWQFDEEGRCQFRHASINDLQISESERLYRWDAPGPRPGDHPGLTDLGL